MDDEESVLKLAGEYASIGLDDNDTPGSDAVLFGLDDFKEFCKQYRAQAIAEENNRLRLALKAILDAPGGGPARRIAAQALGVT